MPQLLYRPPEHHTFCPLTMYRSPSRSARVVSDAEVAAGAGLGEQLAPHVLGRQRRPEVGGLLLRRAEPLDRLPRQHEADHVEERRHAGPRALQHPHRVVLGGEAPPAVLDGPVDAREAGLVDAALPGEPGSIRSGGQIGP